MTDEELLTRLRRTVEFCRNKLGNYWIRTDRTGVKEEFENALAVAEECLGRIEAQIRIDISRRQAEADAEDAPVPYWNKD